MPRYRSVPVPAGAGPGRPLRVPDPQSLGGAVDLTILDVEANGYRLRLIDHPAAFDRDGLYGPPGGPDYADNPWRFGLFCRAALEALRAEPERPVDVIHIHDWHACPAAIFRDRWYADDPVLGQAATVLTIHNLAYHGWTPREALGQLGLALGDGVVTDPYGIDLLGAGIERVEMANTVSPGYARESLTPELGFGLDGALRAKGDRYVGILNGLDTTVWDPATDADLAATYSAARPRRQGDLPGRPARSGGLRPDRRRPGARDDRPARSAEGLRPARRRCAAAALERCPHRRARAAGIRRSPLTCAPSGSAGRIGLPSWSGSTGRWPGGSTRASTSSSCRRVSSRAGRAR